MERRKPGRPSKGDRRQLNTLQPRAIAEATTRAAAAQGLTVTDYVGQLLARELGMDYSAQLGLDYRGAAIA